MSHGPPSGLQLAYRGLRMLPGRAAFLTREWLPPDGEVRRLGKPVNLHYQEWGEGPPVVALHGLGLESSSFTGLAEGVAALGLRMLAADLPGFGKTPAPEVAALTPAILAEPVLDLARRLDRKPLVMGMSLGARVALEAALLAPDLFPDMYFGGWFIHSDLSGVPGDRWMANNWMQYVWTKARGWSDAGERDKVLAFAYGFLTHGAGDMWAHTYVNQKADGAWVTFYGPSKSTAIKHIVLEGYVGAHTPNTDLTLDVWPRFVSNVLIKDPAARQHSQGAAHYQLWLDIYDRLEPLIERARDEMNKNIRDDAPYWMKCAANPVPCAKKEQMETWRLDINRGFRALVDSSESLGERLMKGETGEGRAAMTGWMVEWIPKMFGAHAASIGESRPPAPTAAKTLNISQ